MATIEKDAVTGTDTTGHEWDGIKELNTPLPRWWIITLYATIVWSLVYTILYPAWPMIDSATPGLLGYSSRADVAMDITKAKGAQAQWLDKIKASSLADIMKDQNLLEFARAGGAAAFKVNCVQCHGAGAAGSAGYPNLNDNDWLWGGALEQIHQTLTNGIRYTANPDTRDSAMLAFGADGILKPEQISDVANFVATLSGGEADGQAATRGAQVFTENCVACHGEKGEGNKELGAPNLADQISLYGASLKEVAVQVQRPRHGVMPAWNTRLDETTIKQLAVYVFSLGGGEQAPATQ
jgi:cytochrome c oxidase cbb3-type subunit III